MKLRAFHKLSYGLYVVATELNGKRYGYIGNTAFQVTAEPPQLIISSHKNNHTTSKIIESGIFSVSVLQKEVSTALIGTFGFMSGAEIDKFKDIKTITAITGAPLLKDSILAWFDCKVVQTVDVGTHLLFIGEVVESDIVSDEEPLTYDYYREKYRMLAPKNAPTHIDQAKLAEEKIPENKETESLKIEISVDSSGKTYICNICGFHYNPEEGDPTMGIPPGTPFDELPEDYRCPICNAGKDYFREA